MDCDTFSFVLPRPLSISTAHRHPALKRFKRRIRGGGRRGEIATLNARARHATKPNGQVIYGMEPLGVVVSI